MKTVYNLLYCYSALVVLFVSFLLVGCNSSTDSASMKSTYQQGLRARLAAFSKAFDALHPSIESELKELASLAQDKRRDFEYLAEHDEDRSVRNAAIFALAESRGKGLVALFLRTAKDHQEWQRANLSLHGLLDLFREDRMSIAEAQDFARTTNELLVKGHSRLSSVLMECAAALGEMIETDSLGAFLSRRGFWTLEGKRAASLLARRGGERARSYLRTELERIKKMEVELGALVVP